jgi:hypothetical protein
MVLGFTITKKTIMRIEEVSLKPGKYYVKYSGSGEISEEGTHPTHSQKLNTDYPCSPEALRAYSDIGGMMYPLLGFGKIERFIIETGSADKQRAYAVIENDILKVQDEITSSITVDKVRFKDKDGEFYVLIECTMKMPNSQEHSIRTPWIIYTGDYTGLKIEDLLSDKIDVLKTEMVAYVSECAVDRKGMYNDLFQEA